MNIVFVLLHAHEFDNGSEDIKIIGVYSSKENAQEAIERLRGQPGFSSHPDGFHVGRYEVDKDHWVEGFATVE